MRIIRFFPLALLGSAFLCSLAQPAAAATMTLPEFSTKTSGTATSGTSELKGALFKIKCTSGSEQMSMEASRKLGTFSMTYTGCEEPLTGLGCNSLGDSAKTILAVGSWHLVLTTRAGSDVHLVWYLVQEIQGECSSMASFSIAGNVLGKITPANKLTKVFETVVQPNGAGQQEFTAFENDSGEVVKASLMASVNKQPPGGVIVLSIWVIVMKQAALMIN